MRFPAKSILFAAMCAVAGALQGGPAPADPAQKPASTPGPALDRAHTAVLIMDYENDIIAMVPERARGPLLEKAKAILTAARKDHLPVIYVVVSFRRDYPEVNPRNKQFAWLKASGRFQEHDPGVGIPAQLAPQPGEIIVTKCRVGAFSTTGLETILRANGITTLAMCGISTSGVVLSTVRWAADMDYQLLVASDACADLDEEVHRVLMEKILPGQANVLTSQALIEAMDRSR